MLGHAVWYVAVAQSRQSQNRRLAGLDNVAIRLAVFVARFFATLDCVYVKTWHFLFFLPKR
ncbi:hypothetical protein BGCPKDLD_3150 [Methylorubrum suomiense]|uniref:Transposase n=1 Tax=Methylorubrum suomiense TaxID=144191 RepID=A0ABQ4UXK7_9HYPH|nr:hypothetical protein BGCPKDLD_3150 [Methylorubrum suomiense]